MTRAYSFVIVSIIAMAGFGKAIAEDAVPVSVSIQSPVSEVKAGSEVKLIITVTNTSDHDVMLYKATGQDGQAEAVNKIDVRDESGALQPRIDGQMVEIGGAKHIVPKRWMSRQGIRLKAGEKLEDFTRLSNLFDLSKPGKYAVTVRHEMRADSSGPDLKLIYATSNTITIRVVP
jgi:hypothetical protein